MVSGQAGHPVRVQIVSLLKQTGFEWWNSNAFEVAAALAFYAIFSIAPVIVLAFTVASLVLGPEAAQGRLTKEIESSVGPTVAEAVQATALYTYRSGSGVPATVLSIVFFGFGATGFFTQLQSALNALWQVAPKPGTGLRGVLRDRLGSFLTAGLRHPPRCASRAERERDPCGRRPARLWLLAFPGAKRRIAVADWKLSDD